MEPLERDPTARRILGSPKRLFNAIGMGHAEIVENVLSFGCSPDACDKRGNPALIRAVRGRIVESSVVEVLLKAGANPEQADAEGFTALHYAKRRLSKWEGKPRKPPRRSPSLTPFGDVKLQPGENRFLERMRKNHPDSADEFEAIYLDERRKAAERNFDTRGNLERIVELLEAKQGS